MNAHRHMTNIHESVDSLEQRWGCKDPYKTRSLDAWYITKGYFQRLFSRDISKVLIRLRYSLNSFTFLMLKCECLKGSYTFRHILALGKVLQHSRWKVRIEAIVLTAISQSSFSSTHPKSLPMYSVKCIFQSLSDNWHMLSSRRCKVPKCIT